MNGIVHIRIDDRLIHGQVATMWSRTLGVTRLMVANDEVANNNVKKQVLRLAVPSNVASSLISIEKAANNILEGKYVGQKVMLIVSSPVDLLRLIDLGLKVDSVNVGNLSNRPNTEILRPNISVTAKEKEAFEKILAKNIEVTTIMVPDDKKTYLKDII